MKRITVLLAVLALATVAFAQDAPKGSVFGGYQFLSLDGGGSSRESLHGFNFDAAFHAAKNVAIVGDLGMGFKTVSVDTPLGIVDAKVRMYPILFGPRFVATEGKVHPFAEALFGVTHMTGSFAGIGGSSNKFSYAFGGGLDVNAGKNVDVRLAKFDYIGVRVGEGVGNLNNIRISTGIVFKF